MKRLALKILLLVLPFALVLAFAEYELRRMPNSYSAIRELLERELPTAEVLITGSSHAQSGVDARLLSAEAVNLGMGSQSLYYDTRLVEKYAGAMPRLRLVIFTLSYHSFEYKLSSGIERWRAGFYRQVYGIPGEDEEAGFSLGDYSYIALYTPKTAYGLVLEQFRGGGVASAAAAAGPGAAGSNGEVTDEFGARRVRLHESQMRRGDADFNLRNLEGACAALGARGVRVAFITFPAHRSYYGHFHPDVYRRMQDDVARAQSACRAEYFNYMFDGRFADEDFLNSDHLNRRGAEKMSAIIDHDIVRKDPAR